MAGGWKPAFESKAAKRPQAKAQLRRAGGRPVAQQGGWNQNRVAIDVIRTGSGNVLRTFSWRRRFLAVDIGGCVFTGQPLFERLALRSGLAGGGTGSKKGKAEKGDNGLKFHGWDRERVVRATFL